MIDETYLRRLPLHKISPGQRVMASMILGPNYGWGRRTEIILEGLEHLPGDRCVLLALNHTDRYNYWPFQYQMWARGNLPYTTSWVKAKYYNDKRLAWFFDRCNNIPLPSLGYVILQDAYAVIGHRISASDYRILRDLAEHNLDENKVNTESGIDLDRILHTPRREFDPQKISWGDFIRAWTDRIMGLVEQRTLEALGPNHNNVIVFPQGTRALRLQRSRTGLVQFALRHNIPIVPVGSNGSEKVYPGASPWAKPGRIVYRIGRPMTLDDDLAPFKIGTPYRPFTADTAPFTIQLRGAADLVDERINALLDPPYQRDEKENEATGGLDRLV